MLLDVLENLLLHGFDHGGIGGANGWSDEDYVPDPGDIVAG